MIFEQARKANRVGGGASRGVNFSDKALGGQNDGVVAETRDGVVAVSAEGSFRIVVVDGTILAFILGLAFLDGNDFGLVRVKNGDGEFIGENFVDNVK